MKNVKYIFLTILFVFIWTQTICQTTKIYRTQRKDSGINIDGRFDDKAWDAIEWKGDFIEFEPVQDKKPSQKTYFKILYDDNSIYVAIKNLDNESDKIEKRLSRRDEWEGDLCGVHFDSYNDKRTSFVFAVSAAGVKNDGFFSNDGDNFDDSWDPVWHVKTSITSEGWYAEMQIPFSQLRFNNNANQIWGLEVVRSIFRLEELSLWNPISKKNKGWVSQYGELQGIKNIEPKRNIEIIPFMVLKAENYKKQEGNPFADGRDYGMEGGVDGKIGITNDLTLDFAINPDFGQVEADPSEVNLTAFETYFQEKRPFFIEGNNITNFKLTPGESPWSRDNLFYSRRIGSNPNGYPDTGENEYVKMPSNTGILAAFKLTGKTKKGWSIGIIESITNKENAIIDNNGVQRKEAVEPFTNYFIARLQKDINKGNTIIGGMLTSTYRNIVDKNLLFLPENAIAGGLDFIQYFKNKKYFVALQIAGSKVSGDTSAINELQLSSRRYYQRPDAEYINYDPARTYLSGTGGNMMAGKQTNRGLSYFANFAWRSPGIELNDVGYLREANKIFQFIAINYKIDKPFLVFRALEASAAEWSGWDFGGNTLFEGTKVDLELQFQNLWHFGMGMNKNGRDLSNTNLRGGPAIYTPGGWNMWFSLRSNSKKKLRGNIGFSLNKGNYDFKNNTRIWSEFIYRPVNTLRFSLSPSFTLYNNEIQYVLERNLEGEPGYVLAGLNQNTFNLTMRLDYNITPDLSIQYYGAPFISSVLYDNFKIVTNPKADDYFNRYHEFEKNEISFDRTVNRYFIDESNDGIADYSFSNPDFNFKQFRSNLVLRWEYIPGSTFFLVWSQGRTEYEECDCKFDFINNIKNLISTTPRDIFLLKLSYRINAGELL